MHAVDLDAGVLAALGIEVESLTHGPRESVELAAHLLMLGAHEAANLREVTVAAPG